METKIHLDKQAKPKSQKSRKIKEKHMETIDEITNTNTEKQRHGCITAWLILMIIANSATAIIYLFASDIVTDNLPGNVSTMLIVSLGIIGVANVAFSVLLLQWKKLGFWGFSITSVLVLGINISIGLDVGQSVFGLIGVGILYGILQIKKDNVTAWENLD